MNARIRVAGTPEECAEAVRRLYGVFDVVSVSRQYRGRGASRLVHVYVEVRL